MFKIAIRWALSLVWLFSFTVAAQAPKTVTFRDLDPGEFSQYLKTVLGEAYAKLGTQIRYLDLPRPRGLRLAVEGELDGEIARVPSLAFDYPTLMPVPFPLYDFSVVLVGDRRKCGECRIEDVDNLAYTQGMVVMPKVIEKHNFKGPVVTPADITQVLNLLLAERIDAALMTNFQLQNIDLSRHPHLVVRQLMIEQGYHYLNEKHRDWLPRLTRELQKMQERGRITELQQKYGIKTLHQYQPFEHIGSLKIVAATRAGRTEANGKGRYWQTLHELFDPIADNVDTEASNWHRAQQLLAEGRADAMVTMWNKTIPENTLYSASHIDYGEPLYLFATDNQTIADIQNGDADKPVCISTDRDMRQWVPHNVEIYSTEKSLDCFAMLDLGRVSGVLDYRSALPDWTEKPYARKQVREGWPVLLLFQNNERGRRLKATFEQRWEQTREQ
ncbi:hypothetical protein CWI84_08330 [Idiomarina tyrosinivorans]|uniref:Uncharacterized protein n=1 Tax=Idiomarina tyrosinivorans TaxID=1445662 RepID=A0A432ZPY9_9GAMM|nr:transporter substrate-binding domain-containing protein [Idiomarina tyrosinivorans]RUO79957.1 hypothetical protein CWI84_08330 [Idiomarina tyrosinivorans]